MKNKIILCLALILSGGLALKAENINDFNNDTYDVVAELNANEIDEGVSNFCTLTNIQIAETNFGVLANGECMTVAEYKSTKWTNGESHVSTPLGGREFRVIPLTDSTKTPYEDMKIRIVVFQDGHIETGGDANIEAGFGSLKPRCQFDFMGFKDFDADWIDEKTIKIVYWPGTRARVTELINVESGKIIYRSVFGIYDSHKNSLQLKNK